MTLDFTNYSNKLPIQVVFKVITHTELTLKASGQTLGWTPSPGIIHKSLFSH